VLSFVFCKDNTVELSVQGDVLGKLSANAVGRLHSTHVIERADILTDHFNLDA